MTVDRAITMLLLRERMSFLLARTSSQVPDSPGDRLFRACLMMSWSSRVNEDYSESLEAYARGTLKLVESMRIRRAL